MPRVLVIEDERKILRSLEQGLRAEGYKVATAATGEAGFRLATTQPFDCLILDLMLPGRSGLDILGGVRQAGLITPVLILTARDTVEDRVIGLDAGADDYLVKPFAFAELLARVRTVLRRGPARPPEVVRVADLEIDLARQKAFRGGVALDLTPKEFVLLALLARRPGEAVSRTRITEHVWGVRIDPGSNVVDVHVRRLRAKADDPFDRKLIHTVRGVGYVLEDRD